MFTCSFTQSVEPLLLWALTELWEASVQATHDFLTEEDIIELRPQVASALAQMELLLITTDTGEPDGEPLAFLGLNGDKVEALFVHPDYRGQGFGSRLLREAITHYHCRFVDVNEQNPQALGFYQHLGFVVTSRSPLDDVGRPFPILHLAFEGQ